MSTSVGRPLDAATIVSLRRQLQRLQRQLEDAMRLELAAAGLSVEEWAALSLLADRSGHTMAEVTEVVGVPGPTATRLVDKMVSSALVHRTADPHDRRKVLVALAPRGRSLVDELAPAQAGVAELIGTKLTDAGAQHLPELLESVSHAFADS